MNRTLAGKIEFKKLCDELEKVSKECDITKKAYILEQFIQKCRIMGHKLKTEFPDMVNLNFFIKIYI